MNFPFATTIPDHVPAELVLPCSLAERKLSTENPYETVIPELNRGPIAFMSPTAYLGVAPAWIVRRYNDVRQIFDDTENFSKKGNSGFAALIGEDWDAIPTELDPPRHTEVRRVLNPLFTPTKVAELEGKVRQRAQEYVAKIKARGHCDFAKDFAVPYPVSIFLDLFGLPQDGMEQFLEWEFSLIHASKLDDRAAGTRAVKEYLMEVIEDRRKSPKDDLISNALSIRIDGVPLTPIEVFGHCFNLYIGGLDTVTANISLHFMHLATHIDQQNELRNNPELIKTGMNELLRAYSSTSHNRICVNEVEIAGITMKPGDKVLLLPPLANRDPEKFDRPDDVIFDRNAINLTFGSGVHNCLGRHLARREVQVALEEVLSALPEFRIAPGADVKFRTGGVIHAAEVPIVW